MSAPNRRSRFLGLFGRHDHSQESITTLNTAATSATTSTAGASAAASATVAIVSGSENSAAMLRNMQNASQELNKHIADMANKDANLVNVLVKNRWLSKVQACPNSSFASCALPEATVDHHQRRLMRLAASGAIRAYKNPAPDDRHCNDFDAVGEALSVDPDRLGGSVKAATVELYTRRGSSDKVIVVAIRGSFIIHDWMVNLNDGAETPVQDDFMGTDGNGNLYAAHSGFLACAKTMKDTVLGNVYRLYSTHFGSGAGAASSSSSSSPGPTLLFTGHSAGGAIAAMLYAHFVNTRAVSGNRAPGLTPRNVFSSVHCITFGAPPITTVPLVPSDPSSICLSVVNDGDPIPRADGKYINALLKIYAGPEHSSTTSHDLPPRTFFNAGRVLVVLPDGSLLRPNESGPGSLTETVMGNKSMHSMNKYWQRMQL